MSPLTPCGGSGALRGGVPILFPQFGAFGPLPKHGFARTSWWGHVASEPDSEAARVVMRLRDSSDTRAIWPAPFDLTLEVVATASVLEMTLTLHNLDDYDATFTGGLHNYFRITDPSASVSGLSGLLGWDAVIDPGSPEMLRPIGTAPLAATVERDLIVHEVTAPVVLSDPALGDLQITATGFPNRVVWNPGPGNTLPDLPAGDAGKFVCIEPAAITPVRVAGQEKWVASQRVEVLAH